MGWIPAALGLVSGLISSNSQNHAAQQAAQGQSAADQESMQLMQMLANQYQQYYSPLLQGQESAYSGLQSEAGAQLPGAYGALESYLQNPQNTLSGINGLGGYTLQDLYSQTQNPLGGQGNYVLSGLQGLAEQGLGSAPNTVLSAYNQQGQQGLGPMAQPSFQEFYNEATQGMDPSVWNHAIHSVGDASLQQMNNFEHNLGAAVPNVAGTLGDMSRAGLGAVANESASLASQDQGIRQQGAQGLLGAAESQLQARDAALGNILPTMMDAGGYESNLLSRLAQTGSGLQGLSNEALQAMMSYGGGMDQQMMEMLSSAYSNPMGALGSIGSYIDQGRNVVPGLASGMQGIGNQYASAAQNLAQNQTNPFSAIGNFFASSNPFGGGGGSTVPYDPFGAFPKF